MRALVLSLLLVTATHSWASADTGVASGVPQSQSIPYLPSVASSTNTALGITYRPSLLGQLVGSGAVIGTGFALNGAFPPDDDQGTTADEVGQFLGSPYTLISGTVLYGVHGLITNDHEERTTAKKMTLALGATYATVTILKVTISSDRPDGSDNDSFPSGHAAGSFAAAAVLDRQYGGVTGWIAYGAAAFVAASRVHGTHHRFQDVVAGAVIGHFYGWLFTR